jgi:hypothetical protein
VFHLLANLSEYGSVGYTAIGNSEEEADVLFTRCRFLLDLEATTINSEKAIVTLDCQIYSPATPSTPVTPTFN